MPLINTYDVLRNSANLHGELPAVLGNGYELTFVSLFQQTESLKQELLDAGVGAKTTVAIVFSNGPDFHKALFAVLGCEAAVMPVYTSLTYKEREELYKRLEVDFIFGQTVHLADELESTKNLLQKEEEVLIKRNRTDSNLFEHYPNAACLRFSSGTTGAHKGVVLSHESVLERIEAVRNTLEIKPGLRVLWILPMAYHYIATVIAFVKHGVTLVLSDAIFSKELINTANEHKVDMLYVSPLHIRLLAADESNVMMPSVKTVVSTSSGTSQALCEGFYNRMGIPVSQAYGIIEVGLPLVNRSKVVAHGGRLGKAIPPYEATILDQDGRELSQGQAGRFAVKGPGMFDGYHHPLHRQQQVLEQGWFVTGDIATWHNDGSFEISGREKSVINVAGNKVFPEEVEAVLESMEEILEAHVFAEHHSLMGEFVSASIVKASDKVKLKDIMAYLKSRLTSYKIPRRITFAKSIEKTSTGKKRRG